MAPFKLKFRMGSSRSTSQEHDTDPQVNEALLTHHNQQNQHYNHHHHHQQQQQQQQQLPQHAAIGASTTTIDSTDCHSLGSMCTNERKSLLPPSSPSSSSSGATTAAATLIASPLNHKTTANNLRLGYVNQCNSGENTLPTTPPPSYEHVLEENTRLAQGFEFAQQQQQHQQHQQQQQNRQLSADACTEYQNSSTQHSSRRSSTAQNSRSSTLFTSLEQLTLSGGLTALNSGSASGSVRGSGGHLQPCTDPDCLENYLLINNERHLQRQQEVDNEQEQLLNALNITEEQHNDINRHRLERNIRVREENVPDSDSDDDNRKESIDSTELLIAKENMSDYHNGIMNNEDEDDDASLGAAGGVAGGLCTDINCPEEHHYNDGMSDQNIHHCDYGTISENAWQTAQQQQQQQQQQQLYYQQQQQQDGALTPEIISNKSSKEIYKDLAKQWGITCKMSDGCRCMECQSHYFDCEFDDNEHQKTDGGLGAGTPMFISEVMHGSACTIL